MVRVLPSGASVNWFGGGAYTPSRAARKGHSYCLLRRLPGPNQR